MIAVVTGANGFIGSHLVEELLTQGFRVRCLDNRKSVHSFIEDARVEYYTMDCSQLDVLSDAPILENVDYVFHLAGGTKHTNLEEFRRSNVLPTKNLLQCLKKKRIQLKRFLYMSSQAAAGPAHSFDQPITETRIPKPSGDYGKSKFEAEHIVQDFSTVIPYTILRPSSVFGPRDVDFLNIFRQVKIHLSVFPGYSNNYISIIYVTDLVKGILQAVRSPVAVGKIYFLSNDDPVRWKDIHRMIANVQDKRVIEFHLSQKLVSAMGRFGDIYSKLTRKYSIINSQKIALSKPKYWICSSERAKQDFGFSTRVSLLDGLRMTHHWYRENGWL